jgi:hypothetical protein
MFYELVASIRCCNWFGTNLDSSISIANDV